MGTSYRLFTIGFTQSTAEHFFARLVSAGVAQIVDVRIANRSQLAGFAKMPDLAFFLERIAGIGYRHEPLLAPPLDVMRAYRAKALSWPEYQVAYLAVLKERQVAEKLLPSEFDMACLLCSEPAATHCHRRLAAEFLRKNWQQHIEIIHL